LAVSCWWGVQRKKIETVYVGWTEDKEGGQKSEALVTTRDRRAGKKKAEGGRWASCDEREEESALLGNGKLTRPATRV